jgi:hypothetical protein
VPFICRKPLLGVNGAGKRKLKADIKIINELSEDKE